ncbi:unnamed protein product [Rotaria magnacalcarata]|uniref:TAF6 C-terminal HEAT repeat domain-containing protein n=1 Tax=Rotaria magnacalcarata TaxID=392030 RepID=A0A8S2KL40_9BILA|nr:unnamed protein product [Rotaria magnacalcarata]
MSVQFSVQSIEYLTEKLSNGRCLCDESVAYLTAQIGRVIFNLLEDSCKFVRKCRRNEMIANDFAFALKLNHIKPIYGYTTKNIDRSSSFRKIKKDNRILYHIDDNIIALNDLITSQVKVPFDLSIRAHWLAVDGQQPITNENPIVNTSIRSVSQNILNKSRKLLSTEQQIYYKELTEMCICLNEKTRKQALLILSSDNSLQQVISRVIIFISEGVRVIIQIVFPLIKQLGEKIRLISDRELSLKMTEVIVKFITIAYRSVQNDNESNEKKLYEDFGSYFAPLIQRQLILLL